jgi:hypothetical protein
MSEGLAMSARGTLVSAGAPALVVDEMLPVTANLSNGNGNATPPTAAVVAEPCSWPYFRHHPLVQPHARSLSAKCHVICLSSDEAVFAAAAAAIAGDKTFPP